MEPRRDDGGNGSDDWGNGSDKGRLEERIS